MTLHLSQIPRQKKAIVHFVADHDSNKKHHTSHLPSISVSPGGITVTIVAGVNCHAEEEHLGIGASMVVRGHPETMLCTNLVHHDNNPKFDYSQELTQLTEDDFLDFTVYSQPKKSGGGGTGLRKVIGTTSLSVK